jgi:menaquinone-specific isochorismate synthase
MHLATDVTGALAEKLSHVDAFTILEQLHPSAAVCGTPREQAAELIAEIEGMSRGRYAGPVGWIDAAGDGELGIALRCGQINGRAIRIFAGCGIVAGSDPAKELAESEAKLVPMRSALN